ncbi:MAG: hypothetical protein MJE12_03005 [Alphaproteobacteria bacterium]|nr:hypothetical protein [Alphaproteobacteria bacterium]
MKNELETWQLAKTLLERQGLAALYNARNAAEMLRISEDQPVRPDPTNVVRAMDFLLSDEDACTIH